MVFEDFEPIFGEPKVEWSNRGPHPLRRFLFYVHALDPSHLRIHVTDFHSNTWEAVRSVHQLEDMMDSTGIGGSWSEFVDYFVASLKSENVKFVLEGSGAVNAKLVAQKSKGMPLIYLSLVKLKDFSASEAMGNLTLDLFRAFKSMQAALGEGQKHRLQLTKGVSDEKESTQSKVDSPLKKHKTSPTSDVNGSHESPVEEATQDQTLTKVANRVVPARRRARVRGAQLQDSESEG